MYRIKQKINHDAWKGFGEQFICLVTPTISITVPKDGNNTGYFPTEFNTREQAEQERQGLTYPEDYEVV